MRALSLLALGITLAATVATAGAQTVISRQVSEELVETIVTQDAKRNRGDPQDPARAGSGSRSAVAGARYLQSRDRSIHRVWPTNPDRSIPAYDTGPVYPPPAAYDRGPVYPPPVAYDPAPVYPPPVAYDRGPVYPPPVAYGPPGYGPPVRTVVELPPEPVDVVTTRQYVRPAARAVVTRQVVVRPNAPIVARTDIRPVRRVQRAVVLTPAEQRVVYRTIVQQQVIPAAPVVRDPYWGGAPIVARTDVAPVPAVYPVGSVLPTAVPLYGVPETVAVRVPTARPYSYAYIGGRIYLVDPVSSVIVADVTQY